MPKPRQIGKPTWPADISVHQNMPTSEREKLATEYTFIHDNQHNIAPGHYNHRDLVALLRQAVRYPRTVRFIADMME